MRFDQYAGHCIVSNFRLHRVSHSQISTAMETPTTPMLARSNLIRLPSLDWPSWLLLPAASALSCHLFADHPVSLHIVDRHWWKNSVQSFTFGPKFICFSHPWHLPLLKLGFSTKLHLHCLHLTCVCGLLHHPPLLYSGNVSDHHLAGTARYVEDETRNAELNGGRNPEWWGDFSQLVKIEKIKSLDISRYKVEVRFWLDLNAEVSCGTNSNWDFSLIWICSSLKSPHHSGFRLPFNSAFRVSCSTEQAVVTRPADGHPSSVLSQDFNESNFAILAICPHTLAGCILWSGPETQLGFRVHLPTLAGSSTTIHSSPILQNAAPCYVCSPLSVRQVASV